MNFKKAYKFPLENSGFGKVFTKGGSMAFDFPLRLLYPDAFHMSKEDRQKVVDIINGGTGSSFKHDFEYCEEEGEIKCGGKEFIIIRGWGHLTGAGGLRLDCDTAKKVQDDFARHILKRISNDEELPSQKTCDENCDCDCDTDADRGRD